MKSRMPYRDLLPACWLGKRSFAIPQRSRELAGCQIALADALNEGRILPQFSAMELVGIEDANQQFKILRNSAYWLGQVGVIRDENCNFKTPLKRIAQQMGS